MNQPGEALAQTGKQTHLTQPTPLVEPDAVLNEAEDDDIRESIPWQGTTIEQVSKEFSLAAVDTHQPEVRERLRKRASNGRYEIPEAHLVLGIRAFAARGDQKAVSYLSEVLLDR